MQTQELFSKLFFGKASENVMIYYILEQLKETILKFSKRTTKVLWIIQMVEYSKVNVKLIYTQLKKLKTAVKNKTGAPLRMSFKMFDGNDLPSRIVTDNKTKNKAKKCI